MTHRCWLLGKSVVIQYYLNETKKKCQGQLPNILQPHETSWWLLHYCFDIKISIGTSFSFGNRRVKKNLHFIWWRGKHNDTGIEKRLRCVMLPLPQPLMGKTGSPGTQLLSCKPYNPRGNGWWPAVTLIQTQFEEPTGIHPRILREPAVLSRPSSFIHQQ